MINYLPLIGAAGGAAAGLFGTPNYKAAYDQYADTMQNLAGGYNPYIRAGAGAEGGLAALGIHNLRNPAALENQLASSFTDSPYQQQIEQNTSKMMNANAAQTGLLESTAQQAALQNALASQQNQWQQQYIDRGTNEYNRNLQNLQSLGVMLGQQGYGAFGKKQGMEQEAALGRLKGEMQYSPEEMAMLDALGGFIGGVGGFGSKH